jgi:hypothetical protein
MADETETDISGARNPTENGLVGQTAEDRDKNAKARRPEQTVAERLDHLKKKKKKKK